LYVKILKWSAGWLKTLGHTDTDTKNKNTDTQKLYYTTKRGHGLYHPVRFSRYTHILIITENRDKWGYKER